MVSYSQGGTQQSKENHPSRKHSAFTTESKPFSPLNPTVSSSISVELFRTGSHSHRKQARGHTEPLYTVIRLLDTITL